MTSMLSASEDSLLKVSDMLSEHIWPAALIWFTTRFGSIECLKFRGLYAQSAG